MSLLDNMFYEYEYQNAYVDEADEWYPITLDDNNMPAGGNAQWLRAYAQGYKQNYRVRYRAVVRSDWEEYKGEV